MNVVIIGAGKMGSAIAKELATDDVPVTLWNRTPQKLDQLKLQISSASFKTSTDLKECVSTADVIIALLPPHQ